MGESCSTGRPTEIVRQGNEPSRLVVDKRHAVVFVQRDHSLPDAVKRCLALLHERRDLVQFQAEGGPLQAAREGQRGDDTDGQRAGEVQEQRGQLMQ